MFCLCELCCRLKEQKTDRSERLEAAYDELMDDDDFDEMIIDNQTTMYVDKTPVHTSSASRTHTNASRTHTSASGTHTSASRISENLNSEREGRNFERQNIDGSGDHSKSGVDNRIPRPQSPVAGTSKDDSESPVIPVVHPGTKV